MPFSTKIPNPGLQISPIPDPKPTGDPLRSIWLILSKADIPCCPMCYEIVPRMCHNIIMINVTDKDGTQGFVVSFPFPVYSVSEKDTDISTKGEFPSGDIHSFFL